MCCTVSTFLQSLSCLTQNARVEFRIYRQEMTFILIGNMNPGDAPYLVRKVTYTGADTVQKSNEE